MLFMPPNPMELLTRDLAVAAAIDSAITRAESAV